MVILLPENMNKNIYKIKLKQNLLKIRKKYYRTISRAHSSESFQLVVQFLEHFPCIGGRNESLLSRWKSVAWRARKGTNNYSAPVMVPECLSDLHQLCHNHTYRPAYIKKGNKKDVNPSLWCFSL